MLRRIARPMLASWFIYDGYDALRHPSSHVEVAREPLNKAVGLVGGEPLSDSTIKRVVQAQGGATIVLGTALALSKTPRTAGLLLALSTAPHAIMAAPKSLSDLKKPEGGKAFFAKLGAVGAALLVAVDTSGKPSIGWRVAKARTDRAEVRELKQTSA